MNSGFWLVQEFNISSFSMIFLEKLVNMHSMVKKMPHKQQFPTSDFYLNTIIYLFTIYKERTDNRNANKQLF